jgi:hypothetical protein
MEPEIDTKPEFKTTDAVLLSKARKVANGLLRSLPYGTPSVSNEDDEDEDYDDDDAAPAPAASAEATVAMIGDRLMSSERLSNYLGIRVRHEPATCVDEVIKRPVEKWLKLAHIPAVTYDAVRTYVATALLQRELTARCFGATDYAGVEAAIASAGRAVYKARHDQNENANVAKAIARLEQALAMLTAPLTTAN